MIPAKGERLSTYRQPIAVSCGADREFGNPKNTSVEGKASVNTETEAVRDAELRYAQRYRTPRVNPKRVVIEVRVERVLGSSDLLDRAED